MNIKTIKNFILNDYYDVDEKDLVIEKIDSNLITIKSKFTINHSTIEEFCSRFGFNIEEYDSTVENGKSILLITLSS